MIFRYFKNRRRRKYLAELVTLRRSGDDLFSAGQKEEFDRILAGLRSEKDPALAVKNAEKSMEKLVLPGNGSSLRNLLDLLLVVGAVAFGIRGLYFQPFRIPTSSMQPTLYGIHYQEADAGANRIQKKFPPVLRALFFANTPARARVTAPGVLDPSSLRHGSGFVFDRTGFTIGGTTYTLPGDPVKVADYAKLDPAREYRTGDVLADGYVSLGDHLFVERFSLYLAPPERGEVMVFTTGGLQDTDGTSLAATSGHYYIKRLAALPGDTVKIEGSQLFIRPAGGEKFVRAQELSPRFAKVYSGKGGYQGHASGMGLEEIASGKPYTVPPGHYFMLGDNSRFSKDSRFFGAVPRRNLVGRAFFTFWPFSRRWGLVDRQGPVDVPTGDPGLATFPVMYKQ